MTPKETLDKAKVHLLMKQGTLFLSSISVMLDHKISTDVPTAATNGTYVKYNPDFFMELTPEERVGLMAHEIMHIAFEHMIRRGTKDPKVWNQAADHVINLLLVKNNFKLPKDGLYDHKFTGMSTEQVYDYLIKNPEQQPNNFSEDIEESLSEEQIEKVTNTVVKAIQRAQLSGDTSNIPEEILRVVKDLINPKLSWVDVLHRYLDANTRQEESWSKPNKRYAPQWYLPSVESKRISNLTVAIDTSGSINDELLKSFLSEIEYINQTIRPDNLTILDCDYRIHNIHEIDSNDSILDLKFSGGGNTSLKPPIEYCKTHGTNLLVYFTDLYANPITEDPGFPILWICYSNHEPSPVGETVYINMDLK
jgi:predicted metal-dependent peptidase